MTDFDRLIDAAAREMTTAPAPVDLRAKVIEEIRTGDTRLRTGDHWWLAAAAGIVLAIYLGFAIRQGRSEDRLLPSRDIAQGSLLAVPSVAPSFTGTAAGPLFTPVRVQPAAAMRLFEPTIVSIPALDGPAAIGIAPLDATSDPLPALDAVEPLDVEQLDIKPLTPPGPAAGGQ